MSSTERSKLRRERLAVKAKAAEATASAKRAGVKVHPRMTAIKAKSAPLLLDAKMVQVDPAKVEVLDPTRCPDCGALYVLVGHTHRCVPKSGKRP